MQEKKNRFVGQYTGYKNIPTIANLRPMDYIHLFCTLI